MKVLFWSGLAALVLGLVSLVAPIRSSGRDTVKAVGVSVEIETRREQKVSPVVSAIMIFGGAGMLIAGKRKN